MGNIIDFYQMVEEEAMLNRLLVYMNALQKMFEPKSVSKELADRLLACRPNRRSMKLEQIFNAVLDLYPDGVTIKDIDVMFNPEYRVDIHITTAGRVRRCMTNRAKEGRRNVFINNILYAAYQLFIIVSDRLDRARSRGVHRPDRCTSCCGR